MNRITVIVVQTTTLLVLICNSCSKLVGTGSPTNTGASIFENDTLALASLVGVYWNFMHEDQTLFNGGVSWLAALSADELRTNRTSLEEQFLYNSIEPENRIVEDTLWRKAYYYIYQCNTLLEGVTGLNHLSSEMRNRIMGEAKFLRAFCYYYLTNLFGAVPLVLETDYTKTAYLPRMDVTAIYQQLIGDVTEAERLLQDGPTAFVTKSACHVLLARMYMQIEDWFSAEVYSSLVIDSGHFQLEQDLDDVFKKTSKEIIFQLEPVKPAYNAMEGWLFSAPTTTTPPNYFLTAGLEAAFELGDQRKAHWTKNIRVNGIDYVIPYKYKISRAVAASDEYNVVFRLAELYLLRAEARARQLDIAGAVADLNSIRRRAGLPDLQGPLPVAACLTAIEQERRIELFTEWGHRWMDLNPMGRADTVLGVEKGAAWQSTDQRYPIPYIELLRNQNLIQNQGYE